MYKWTLTACAMLCSGPASAETLDSYLERDGSHALLVLEIPFDLLQQRINTELLDQYSGSKPDPTDALVDDTLTWSARPSEVNLVQQGDCLMAEVSARGTARVKGKIDLLLGKVPASASADLRAEATFQACPKLESDWSLDPRLSGSVRLSDADVYGISLRGFFQSDLDQAVREGLRNITSDLQDPSFMRDEVIELWKSICQLSYDGNEIAVLPHAVAATQPVVRTDTLRISFVVSGNMVKHQEPAEPCPLLPSSLILLD